MGSGIGGMGQTGSLMYHDAGASYLKGGIVRTEDYMMRAALAVQQRWLLVSLRWKLW